MMRCRVWVFLVFLLLGAVGGAFGQTEALVRAGEQARQQREEVVAYARQLLGTAYYTGAPNNPGMDNEGFVARVFRDSAQITLRADIKSIYNRCRIGDPVYREPGDLLFFRLEGVSIDHVGIYVGENQFIHAQPTGLRRGVIMSSLDEFYWHSHFYSLGVILPSIANPTVTKMIDPPPEPVTFPENDFQPVTGEMPPGLQEPPSPYSTPETEGWLAEHISFDWALTADWSAFANNGLLFYLRGGSALFWTRLEGDFFTLGLGTGATVDIAMGVARVPLLFSVLINDMAELYIGPVYTRGFTDTDPHIPKAKDGNGDPILVKASVFPGIFGFAWHSAPLVWGNTEIRILQDVHYSVFNKGTDNSALSPMNGVISGLVFSTGLSFRRAR